MVDVDINPHKTVKAKRDIEIWALLGVGLRLLKQQLESRARGDRDLVVCCRRDIDHLLTKEQTEDRFKALFLICSSDTDGAAHLILSLCPVIIA